MGKKPNGYWKDWSNLEKELLEVIEKIGHFPTYNELRKMEKNILNRAIGKYHEGTNAVRKKMGYGSIKKSKKYFQDWNNLEKELSEVISNEYRDTNGKLVKKKGDFPNHDQLKKIGKSSISTAINKYHKSTNSVRKKMGYEIARKPEGYLQSWNNLEKELKKIISNEYKDENGKLIKKKGEFPSPNQLRKMGKSSIGMAINKYHNGFSYIRKKMRYEIARKPDGYWQDWNNLEKELKIVVEEIGNFPTRAELIKTGKSSIGSAISKHHGGSNKVREKMGFPSFYEQNSKTLQICKELILEFEEYVNRNKFENFSFSIFARSFDIEKKELFSIGSGWRRRDRALGRYSVIPKRFHYAKKQNSLPPNIQTLEDYIIHHLPTQELKEKAHYYISGEYLEDLAKPNKKLFERIEEELFV